MQQESQKARNKLHKKDLLQLCAKWTIFLHHKQCSFLSVVL